MEFLRKITGKDIAKSSRSGIFKPKLQAEILQNYTEVEYLKQNYRYRYYKILKWWDFKTKITGRDIANFSRSEITGEDIAKFSRVEISGTKLQP